MAPSAVTTQARHAAHTESDVCAMMHSLGHAWLCQPTKCAAAARLGLEDVARGQPSITRAVDVPTVPIVTPWKWLNRLDCPLVGSTTAQTRPHLVGIRRTPLISYRLRRQQASCALAAVIWQVVWGWILWPCPVQGGGIGGMAAAADQLHVTCIRGHPEQLGYPMEPTKLAVRTCIAAAC